jgi:hypothetical protein
MYSGHNDRTGLLAHFTIDRLALVGAAHGPQAELGRKGGKKKVPKGLATMEPEETRKIRSAGGKAQWAKKRRSGKPDS